ncbi:MAG TPA: type II CAAX endopeptidase family protein [Edaphocola sp.]|nr:type II CAAX endopeptidase family protein [Edaphocola sp.]
MRKNSFFQIQKMSIGLQLVFFIFSFFIGNSVLFLISLIGLDRSNLDTLAFMMIGTQLISFLLPAIAFILLLPKKPISFLHFKPISSISNIVWIIILAISCVFFVSTTSQFLQYLPLGKMADQLQSQRESMEQLALEMKSMEDLLLRLLIMAALPAIGEEIFFRGILQRFVHSFWKNAIGAAIITAVIFALFHGSIYNIIPITIAGTILGLVYYYTGNIWYNIILHFIINGSQVVFIYLSGSELDFSKSGMPLKIAIPGFIISGILITFIMVKLKKNNIALGKTWVMPYQKNHFYKTIN